MRKVSDKKIVCEISNPFFCTKMYQNINCHYSTSMDEDNIVEIFLKQIWV